MLRVTNLTELLWPHTPMDFQTYLDAKCEEVGRKTPLKADKVLKWSADFGTKMHAWCLEDKKPKKPTKLMLACYEEWLKFMEKEDIKLLSTEQKVLYEDLYHGRYDMLAEWDGIITLIDLKFWKLYMWAFLKKVAPTEYKENGTKMAKVNFQTSMYAKAERNYSVDSRAVISISPLGVFPKFFRRTPHDKIAEAIKICESERDSNDF